MLILRHRILLLLYHRVKNSNTKEYVNNSPTRKPSAFKFETHEPTNENNKSNNKRSEL